MSSDTSTRLQPLSMPDPAGNSTPGTHPLNRLDTPALVLDAQRVEANAAMMRERARTLGVSLRPHVKTSKCLDVARIACAGKTGPITVSTLKEAEQFFASGFTDILYAVGITPNKLPHVARLRQAGCDLKILLDSLEAAQAIVHARQSLNQDLPCLLEIDCDGHRSGLKPDDKHLTQIADTLKAGGVTVVGVLTHAGESYNCRGEAALQAMAEQERTACVQAAYVLRAGGHACPVVSVGSTPTARYARHLDGVTELRAGVYIFFDLVMAGIGACDISDIALSVLVTVIGHQEEKGWIVTDGGWMAMSRDRGTAKQAVDQGYGLVCDLDGKPIEGLIMSDANQEHGILSFRATDIPNRLKHDFPLGRRLRILPNHACSTSAQHSQYNVTKINGDASIMLWPRFNGW